MQKGTPPRSIVDQAKELIQPAPKTLRMRRYEPEYNCSPGYILIECEKKHTPDCIFGLLPEAPILESNGYDYLTAHGRYHLEIEIPDHDPNSYRRNLKCSYMKVFCNCYSCFTDRHTTQIFVYDDFLDDNPREFFEENRYGKKKPEKEVEQRTKEFKIVAEKIRR